MIRLGLKVPDTWLIPRRVPPGNPRYGRMDERYNPSFDLDEVAERIGYPIFMKPFDGGAWVGVTRVADSAELHRGYDGSGERLMHLQGLLEQLAKISASTHQTSPFLSVGLCPVCGNRPASHLVLKQSGAGL